MLLGNIIDDLDTDTSVRMREHTYPEWAEIRDASPRPAYRATGDNWKGKGSILLWLELLVVIIKKTM